MVLKILANKFRMLIFALITLHILTLCAFGQYSYNVDNFYNDVRSKSSGIIAKLVEAGVKYNYSEGNIEADLKSMTKDIIEYAINYETNNNTKLTDANIDGILTPFTYRLMKNKYLHLANVIMEAYPEATKEILKHNIPSDFKPIYDEIKLKLLNILSSNTSGNNGGGGGGTGSITIPQVTVVPSPILTPGPEEYPKSSFKDMDSSKWAIKAVEELKALNIISGVGEDKFEPTREVNREEFIKIICLAFNLYNKDAKANFKDLSISHWSYPYVSSLTEKGLIKGRSDEVFGVGSPILRQEMAVIIERVINYLKIELKGDDSLQGFNDELEVDEYAKNSVLKMRQLNIIKGRDGHIFAPKDTLNRAEGCQVVYNLILNKKQ